MKSTITLSLMLMAGTSAFAQHAITSSEPAPVAVLPASFAKTNVLDTLTQYLDRATAFYTLTAGSSGYVLGTSSVTTQTAVHYDAIGPATVTEIFAYFSSKTVMGGADSCRAIVYVAGTDSMPTTEIGSGLFSVADADVSGFPTIIPISNGQVTTGGFLVAIEYGGAGLDDTLAITSTNPTTQSGGPDGNGEKRVRQLTAQLGWLRAADIWTIGGGAFDADALIIPVVDITAVGVESYVTKAGLTLLPSFPNPANNSHQLVWANDSQEDVTIRVFNAEGRVVLEETVAHSNAGKQSFNLNTGAWASGQYFYMISTGKATLASKFMVQH